MIPVMVGFDEREEAAYEVCEESLVKHCTNVAVMPLKHRTLRRQGLFWREWKIDADGQYWDEIDGKPFSTQFSHSRFLTPHLASRYFPDARWALFCDSDFLFRRNVADLFALADDSYAVMCVQHQQPDTGARKMDGMQQTRYARKNWSSLMLFNLRHPANLRLTPECVNEADGGWLHQFGWLNDAQIGALPPEWNHLATIGNHPDPAAVHFTLGGPWFEEWPRSRFDAEWLATLGEVHAQKAGISHARAAAE